MAAFFPQLDFDCFILSVLSKKKIFADEKNFLLKVNFAHQNEKYMLGH